MRSEQTLFIRTLLWKFELGWVIAVENSKAEFSTSGGKATILARSWIRTIPPKRIGIYGGGTNDKQKESLGCRKRYSLERRTLREYAPDVAGSSLHLLQRQRDVSDLIAFNFDFGGS